MAKRGINEVRLIGNLGADPELRSTGGGTPVTSFRIATSETWKDKRTGEDREATEWHNIVTWDRLAEICGQYLKSGMQVYIAGRLKTRSYQKDGVTHYRTEIHAEDMQMLGGRGAQAGANQPASQAPTQQAAPQQPQQQAAPPQPQQQAAPPQPQQQAAPPPPAAVAEDGLPDFTEDDIPF